MSFALFGDTEYLLFFFFSGQCFAPLFSQYSHVKPVQLCFHSPISIFQNEIVNYGNTNEMNTVCDHHNGLFHLYSRSSLHNFILFHSCHGLMNSINWPARSLWVFIAQLVELCSSNAEATGSNTVEAPKNLFFDSFSEFSIA